MKIEGRGKMLKIYVGETDQFRGAPLYHAIVMKAKQMGLAGATVTRGLEGFGANSRIHTANILRLSEDLPVIIDIIDRPDRIDSFIPELDKMVSEGLVISVHDVEILKYSRGKPGQSAT